MAGKNISAEQHPKSDTQGSAFSTTEPQKPPVRTRQPAPLPSAGNRHGRRCSSPSNPLIPNLGTTEPSTSPDASLQPITAMSSPLLLFFRKMATLSPSAQPSAVTALHIGSRHGDSSLVSAVLRSPAGKKLLNAPEHREGLTPLHLASVGGHVEIVKMLVEAGAAPKVATPAGVTPRQFAEQRAQASEPHKKVAEFLAAVEQA